MKKMDIFRRFRKEWAATEVRAFDEWKDAIEYVKAHEKENKKKSVIVCTHERPDWTEYTTVTVYEKKRLAH